MPSFSAGTVVEIVAERDGLQRCMVVLDGTTKPALAVNLTQLTGAVAVGDDVVCNTTAVELGLGTGGAHIVHWNLSRRHLSTSGGGHIMKLRYTSLQLDAGAAEAQDGELAASILALESGDGVDGMPVVVASLHSLVAAVSAGIVTTDPALRVAYVMTDGAALPIALSDLVADLRSAGFVHRTVTTGNAFGGDRESVTVASGLLAARVDGADVAVVAMGPGVVGTGTRYGTTALEVAEAVRSVQLVGGRPVVALRCSDADKRERHRGVSHHSLTALSACRDVDVVVPRIDDSRERELSAQVRDACGDAVRLVTVDPGDAVSSLAAAGVKVHSMGRQPSQDPVFWAAGAAAGVHAARLARTNA